MSEAEKRSCAAITKAGKRCKAKPLTDSEHCMAHADAETRSKYGFIGRNGGRPKHPRLVDRLAEKVEADLEAWLAPLERARDAERGVVVGSGKDAEVVFVPDLAIQLQAVREVFDRLVGRPKQTQEITGAGGGPIEVLTPAVEERRLEVARILQDASNG